MNIKKIALLGGVGIVSVGLGIAVPQFMNSPSHEAKADTHEAEEGHVDGHKDEHATKDKKAEKKDDHAKPDPHAKKEAKKEPKKDAHDAHAKKDPGHGPHGGEPVEEEPVDPDAPAYLPFDRMVLNINDPTYNLFMNLEIAVQTTHEHEEEVAEAMKLRHAAIKTWITTHVADKTRDDLSGKVGVNKLRREIQDNFNSLLFDDGSEHVKDVLFEEYLIQ